MTYEEMLRDEPWQFPLWDAINEFRAGNQIARERAVVKVNEVVRDAIATGVQAGLDSACELMARRMADFKNEERFARDNGENEIAERHAARWLVLHLTRVMVSNIPDQIREQTGTGLVRGSEKAAGNPLEESSESNGQS